MRRMCIRPDGRYDVYECGLGLIAEGLDFRAALALVQRRV